jgi:choice-of-anchor C domain-containing protein
MEVAVVRRALGAVMTLALLGVLMVPGVASAGQPKVKVAAGLTNGGFEQGNYAPNYPGWENLGLGSTAMTGWTVSSGDVDWIDDSTWQSAEDQVNNLPMGSGYKSVDLDGNSQGAITSDAFTTVPGATYVVQFYLSGNWHGGPDIVTLNVSASAAGSSVGTYDFNLTGISDDAAMGYILEAYSFVASDDSTQLTFASGTPGGCGPVIDLVSVTRTIAAGAQCKDGGWTTLQMWDSSTNTWISFRNQGRCVSYFATSHTVPIRN